MGDGTPKDDIASAKQQLRRQVLARRDGLDEAWRIEGSLALGDRALGFLGPIDPGTVVSGFLPIRSEVDIRPLMAALGQKGARLCVPAIVEGELQFRELRAGAPLEPQGFGTYAPGSEAEILDPQLMLVPLAAFDTAGRRLGYGRGYYDRAIERLEEKGISPRLIGIAFDAQEADRVPTEPHDRRLTAIVTESRVIDCGL
ncbi:MAG: 5-formyltetrahydrofolate cyclo-ligase [Fulvimarina manganoxydans]|uniref:5-formyltetrahydrofolate cyclo-ligase n=1 Tax=Fulvimarina manganoxydans TaxID=937218 RepID=UPI002354C460|nr:5-formyltetrahydrofolate cyclo-ligase [Fulvimarina manganoxydans]MCK5930580.1 5-formyltetrahydrofolate cyclo-ligase [Fulvimarina manganoxydans]